MYINRAWTDFHAGSLEAPVAFEAGAALAMGGGFGHGTAHRAGGGAAGSTGCARFWTKATQRLRTAHVGLDAGTSGRRMTSVKSVAPRGRGWVVDTCVLIDKGEQET